MSDKTECPKCRTLTPELTQVTELARWLNHYFNSLRHNTNHHLGLGDVRLTISMQEEIIEYIRKYESKTL